MESFYDISELLNILGLKNNEDIDSLYNPDDPEIYFALGQNSRNRFLSIIRPYEDQLNLEVFKQKTYSTVSKPDLDCKNCQQVTKFLQKICFKEDENQSQSTTNLQTKKTIRNKGLTSPRSTSRRNTIIEEQSSERSLKIKGGDQSPNKCGDQAKHNKN